jgi:phospho-N-acetylmuramoyl-pentapeptide-transferase
MGPATNVWHHPWFIALVSGLAAVALFGAYRCFLGPRMYQAFRKDGPAHHLKKGRVPTGAGVVLIIFLFITGILLWPLAENGIPDYRIAIYVCWAAGLMGLLGLVDDRSKVVNGSAGLKARFKLPVMLLVGMLLLYLIYTYFHSVTGVIGAFAQPWPAYAPWWIFFPVGLFVWLGAINGANFTDGLDGLLASTTLIVIAGAFYALLDGDDPLSVPAAVGFGVLAAYLIFNWKPAKLYVGDSGSLTVGALVAGLFLAKGWWLFLGLCVFIWVVNVASVMVQVLAVRLIGKRVLLMSPLHHHFELAGWGERRIVLVFSLLQFMGCCAAFVWLRHGAIWGMACTSALLGTLAVLLLIYHRRVRD